MCSHFTGCMGERDFSVLVSFGGSRDLVTG
jgi:hypothetical protein